METKTILILYMIGMLCFLLLIVIEIWYQQRSSKQQLIPINDTLKLPDLSNKEIDFIETARKDYLKQFEFILCSIHHMILKSNPSYYRENNRDIVLVLDMKLHDLNPPDLRIICHSSSGQLEVVYDHHTDIYDSIQQINMSKSLMLNT